MDESDSRKTYAGSRLRALPALPALYGLRPCQSRHPHPDQAALHGPDINTRTRNALLRSGRCPGSRVRPAQDRWRMLWRITASPGKISEIIRAVLVLTHFEHGCLNEDC